MTDLDCLSYFDGLLSLLLPELVANGAAHYFCLVTKWLQNKDTVIPMSIPHMLEIQILGTRRRKSKKHSTILVPWNREWYKIIRSSCWQFDNR